MSENTNDSTNPD